MREITDHVVDGDTAPQLKVYATDEPGPGGANHEYLIRGKTKGRLPSTPCAEISSDGTITFDACHIRFQNGPIKEVGMNGIQSVVLLAVVIDQLRAWQKGPFACEANENALHWTTMALQELQRRTKDRIARGVEGLLKA